MKAAARTSIVGGHTVVALAGATGSGKSSLFNDLTGADVAPIGARRPTTSTPIAAIWGSESASALLDWLKVGARHMVDERPSGGTGSGVGRAGPSRLSLGWSSTGWCCWICPTSTPSTRRTASRPIDCSTWSTSSSGSPTPEVRRRAPARGLHRPAVGPRRGHDRGPEPGRPPDSGGARRLSQGSRAAARRGRCPRRRGDRHVGHGRQRGDRSAPSDQFGRRGSERGRETSRLRLACCSNGSALRCRRLGAQS